MWCPARQQRDVQSLRQRVREMVEEAIARCHTAARETCEAEYSCERAAVAARTAAVVEESMALLGAAEDEQSARMCE